MRRLEGQLSLAYPAGGGQCEQAPRVLEQLVSNHRHLVLATNERHTWRRQVRGEGPRDRHCNAEVGNQSSVTRISGLEGARPRASKLRSRMKGARQCWRGDRPYEESNRRSQEPD